MTEAAFMPVFSVWYFLSAFFLVTVILFLLLRAVKNRIFFEIIFSFALWIGVETILSLFLPPLFSSFTALVLILLRYLILRIWFYNLILILGVAGIAAALGLTITSATAILILLVLSVYDIVAVFKTKHIVKMAKGLLERKVIFFLIIPQTVRGFGFNPETVGPGKNFIILGTGDLLLPVLFSVSAYASHNFTVALGVMIGALAGVGVLYYLFFHQKIRRPLPALPPLALFSILGYFVSFLF